MKALCLAALAATTVFLACCGKPAERGLPAENGAYLRPLGGGARIEYIVRNEVEPLRIRRVVLDDDSPRLQSLEIKDWDIILEVEKNADERRADGNQLTHKLVLYSGGRATAPTAALTAAKRCREGGRTGCYPRDAIPSGTCMYYYRGEQIPRPNDWATSVTSAGHYLAEARQGCIGARTSGLVCRPEFEGRCAYKENKQR